MATLQDLLAQFGCEAYDKQDRLSRLLEGTGRWDADLMEGRIAFENGPRFQIQALGSEDNEDGTWLWAWANHSSSLSEEVLRDSIRVRQYGETIGVSELTKSLVPLSEIGGSGHTFGMLACSITESYAYYCAPNKGGAVYLLMRPDEAIEKSPEDDTADYFLSILMQFIEGYPVNHRRTLESFAAYKKFLFEDEQEGIVCISPHGEKLHFKFDDYGRIVQATGTLTAAPAVHQPTADEILAEKAKAPWWKFGRN